MCRPTDPSARPVSATDLKGDAQTGPVRQRETITRKFAELGVEPEDITWAEDLARDA
jgi:hypothetical protein